MALAIFLPHDWARSAPQSHLRATTQWRSIREVADYRLVMRRTTMEGEKPVGAEVGQ